MSDNAYINYLEEQNAELRRELAEAKEHIERMTKPWRFQLITLPVPRKQEPGDYPDLSESYELSLVDTGHSERVYLLGSNELDKRINDLQSQLTAANATIAACKEAGFIDAEGRVRKVAHGLPLPITADGYIAMYGETYWYWDTINGYCDPIEYGWTNRELESCRPQDAEYSWTTNPSLCYYDLDAAKASKQKGQP